MHKTHSNGLILACESSCDETAWSIYDIYKKSIITNTIFSQIKKHASYGGVVPEIASQEHLIIISSLLKETLNNAKMKLSDIDYFACTTNPGLPGSLLIGCNYTKSLSWNYKKPFIGVNHLAGHIYSACIEHEVEFPFLCLSVSGGHTSLYYVISTTEYSCISSTRDDAAGELFDKIAKILKYF